MFPLVWREKEYSMRKILFISVLMALLLASCAPASQGLANLPDEGKLLVLTLVTSLLTFLLVALAGKIGWDLGGYVQPLAAVLSPIVITVIESFLIQIPPAYDSFVTTIIHLIVLLFGSVGTVIVIRSFKARARMKQLLFPPVD